MADVLYLNSLTKNQLAPGKIFQELLSLMISL